MGVKKVISVIDVKYLHGILFRGYRKVKNRLNREEDFFHKKKAVVLKEPVTDMILMQIDQNENQFAKYCAYDFAVRYLAIENYYCKNDYGFRLYKKMHTLGGNYGQINEVENYYNSVRKKKSIPKWGTGRIEQHSVTQFQKLLKSIEIYGFDENSLVMADRNLLSMNGSHRVTAVLYNRMDYINVEVHNNLFQRRFTIDYFWEKGFTKEEIDVIDSKMEDILRDCRERIGHYYCILFPPAEKYFDEITQDINLMEKGNISVAHFKDYVWEVPDFVGFLKGLYYFDSIQPENLERKLYYILRSSEIRNNRVKFRIVALEIKHPMYRLKKDNGMPEAVATVRLKDMIRGRYRVKEKRFTEHYVGDYAHDVIIHSSDNFISNNAFRDLLSVNRDLTAIMDTVNQFHYVIAAFTKDKVSEKFPQNYYMDEDIDIFVEAKDLDAVTEATFATCRRLFDDSRLCVSVEESAFGKRVRITYNGFTLTMFDFMIQFPGIKQEYINKFVSEREGDNYFHLSMQNELIYRTNKFLRADTKTYHKDFLYNHKDELNYRNLLEGFEEKAKKQAEKLWGEILHSQN